MSEQVKAIEWAGRFGLLAIDMERNRDKWRYLAEDYLTALEQVYASLQELRDNLDLPRQALEAKLGELEEALNRIIKGEWWRSYYQEAAQQAQELTRRREEAVLGFIDDCERLRRVRPA